MLFLMSYLDFLSPVVASVATVVTITVWSVAVAIISIPGVSFGVGVGARLSRGSFIGRSLTIVAVSVWPVPVVAITVWSVAVAVVSIPGVSFGVGVGARFGRGGFISRSLSIVAIVSIGPVVTSVSSPV